MFKIEYFQAITFINISRVNFTMSVTYCSVDDIPFDNDDYSKIIEFYMCDNHPHVFALKMNNQHQEYLTQIQPIVKTSKCELSNYINNYFNKNNSVSSAVYGVCISFLYDVNSTTNDSSITLALFDGFNDNLRKKALTSAFINKDKSEQLFKA